MKQQRSIHHVEYLIKK